jgi:hypothetical protein
MAAEALEPVVVDAEHLVGRFVVPDPGRDAENAKNDLSIDAVAVHILDPLIGVARTLHAFLAVLIEARLGHLVDAVILPGNDLSADRSNAADQTHLDTGPGDPLRTVGAILHVRHAVLQFSLRL